MRGNRRGFTLIELLIVVAIIAILAAIAVPNFLEAQVRSKVSRVKSDQRTLATAVEAYSVDYNRVPVGWNECLSNTPMCWGAGANKPLATPLIYAQMTTPVAYVTSVPSDPFVEKGMIGTKNAYVKGTPFEYHSIRDSYAHYSANVPAVPDGFKAAAGKGFSWLMFSIGPSRRQTPDPTISATGALLAGGLAGWDSPNATDIKHPTYLYDPSNGTASFGYIVRTNKQQH